MSTIQDSLYDISRVNVDISNEKYEKLHHIIALDTEKTLQAGYTGLDMKRGQLMTVKVLSLIHI